AYHPDVRRQIAQLSAELEAARLVTYRSAWLYDTEGPTAETTAALFRAKYIVGEAVAPIVRVALTISGSHGIFKGERMHSSIATGPGASFTPLPKTSVLGTWVFMSWASIRPKFLRH